MTFCGQVDDAVNFLILHQLIESLKVTDVHLDELVVGLIFNIFEVSQITGIGQFVQVNDFVIGILVYKQSYNVRADEAGTISDDDIFINICLY